MLQQDLKTLIILILIGYPTFGAQDSMDDEDSMPLRRHTGRWGKSKNDKDL